MQEPFEENQDPRAIRSRQALRAAFLQLLQEKPLDQITIRDIVARADIGYTTFFRHYPSKEAVLGDVASEQIGVLFSLSIPVMDEQNVRSASVALLSYVNEHRAEWSPLLTGGAASAIREEFLRQASLVEAERGQPGAWLPSRLGVALLVSGVLELIRWWLSEPNSLSVEHVAEIMDRTVVTPVLEEGKRTAGENT